MTNENLLALCNTYRKELYLSKKSHIDLASKLRCEEFKENILKTALFELQKKSSEKTKKIEDLQMQLNTCLKKLDELGFDYNKETNSIASHLKLVL